MSVHWEVLFLSQAQWPRLSPGGPHSSVYPGTCSPGRRRCGRLRDAFLSVCPAPTFQAVACVCPEGDGQRVREDFSWALSCGAVSYL